MGSGILEREELRNKLAELQEARETVEKELMTLEGRKGHVERLEHDRNTLMEHYAGMVPKSLDNLSPEERNQIYKMLHIEVLAYRDKSLKVSGILVGGGEAGEMALDGALPRGGLGALGLTRIRESQHTQSAGLQFRALLTEGLDDQLALLELIYSSNGAAPAPVVTEFSLLLSLLLTRCYSTRRAHDVTGHGRAEGKLRHPEEGISAICELASVGVVLGDAEGRVLRVIPSTRV